MGDASPASDADTVMYHRVGPLYCLSDACCLVNAWGVAGCPRRVGYG